jgi:hypothetical protein
LNIKEPNQINCIKPASSAQITRILAPNATSLGCAKEENDPIMSMMYSNNNYNDLIAENASFIDSPIHLLMSHHKNQRMLKQKKHQHELHHKLLKQQQQAKLEQQQQVQIKIQQQLRNDYANVEEKTSENQLKTSPYGFGNQSLDVNEAKLDRLDVSSAKRDLTPSPMSYKSESALNSEFMMNEHKSLEPNEPEKSKNRNENGKKGKFFSLKTRKFMALVFTSMITISSIHLLEIFSSMIRLANTHLIFLKLSTFVFSFIFVITMTYSKDKKSSGEEAKEDRVDELNNGYNTALSIRVPDLKANSVVCKPKDSYYYNIFYEKKAADSNSAKDSNQYDIHDLKDEKYWIEKKNPDENEANLLAPNEVNKNSSNSESTPEDTSNNNSSQTEALIKKQNLELTKRQRYSIKCLYQSRFKTNLYTIIISLLLINFWLISTYLFAYVFSSSSYSHLIVSLSIPYLSSAIEVTFSVIGGAGIALFFKNIIVALFELSVCERNCRVKKLLDSNFYSLKSSESKNSGFDAECASFKGEFYFINLYVLSYGT